jgi:hypothetical protein
VTESVSPLQQAAVVSRSVQIEQVSLRTAAVRSGIDPLILPEKLTLSQSHRARYEIPERHPNKIFVYVDFECTAASAIPSEIQPLGISATYVVVYEHPDIAALPEEALEAFAQLNGVYNVWPYWRELIQTASGRAGLSAIVIPVFRPGVDAVASAPPTVEATRAETE